MLCFTFKGTSPAFRPPETSVIAAGRAEGGAAHRHRDADSADCGAAQAANQRRKRKGELRASATLPRGRSSPNVLRVPFPELGLESLELNLLDLKLF